MNNLIAYISISTQESEDSFSIQSEPEVLISALRLYQGFLDEKAKTYPSWKEATSKESQIAERLIKRIEQALNNKVQLSDN